MRGIGGGRREQVDEEVLVVVFLCLIVCAYCVVIGLSRDLAKKRAFWLYSLT